MDKKTRTERYARCNTPAKRRRDKTVKYRCSYDYDCDGTYLFGPRDAAFFAAHTWTEQDIRELIEPDLLFLSEDDIESTDYNETDATSTSPTFKPPVYSVQANKARAGRRLEELTRRAERENMRNVTVVTGKPKTTRTSKTLDTAYQQSILPKHLRDPECAPRRR